MSDRRGPAQARVGLGAGVRRESRASARYRRGASGRTLRCPRSRLVVGDDVVSLVALGEVAVERASVLSSWRQVQQEFVEDEQPGRPLADSRSMVARVTLFGRQGAQRSHGFRPWRDSNNSGGRSSTPSTRATGTAGFGKHCLAEDDLAGSGLRLDLRRHLLRYSAFEATCSAIAPSRRTL
jgi:hypothetical protein